MCHASCARFARLPGVAPHGSVADLGVRQKEHKAKDALLQNMHVVDQLLTAAVQDNQLLMDNQKRGDRAEIPRDIDFTFYASDEEKANLVASFVTDNRYGRPSVKRIVHEGVVYWRLIVVIKAPTTEHVLHTLSAFMVCLASLYGIQYDGWGSVSQ